LEGGEQKAADARPCYLRGQGAFADRKPDAEPYGEGSETQSQGTDDQEGREEGKTPEALSTLVVELTELRYRRGRCLNPVASAIATGKANSMATRAGWLLSPLSAAVDVAGSAPTPPINTTMVMATKAMTMTLKRLRAECPNQLMAPTTSRRPRARTAWNEASSGR
jgi:hypothetical protein